MADIVTYLAMYIILLTMILGAAVVTFALAVGAFALYAEFRAGLRGRRRE